MEENMPLKRQREETQMGEYEDDEIWKRQKSYKEIISILEQEEDEGNQDISSLISTLQEELSSGSTLGPTRSYETDPENPSGSGSRLGEEEVEGERVMRHLLEASDDELGILPNNYNYNNSTEVKAEDFDAAVGHVDGGEMLLAVGDGLWEFEDHEAANYYNLLQSEIFM